MEGRIDILIKIGSYWIGIENKIYAGDQEKQLRRYHDYLLNQTNENFDLIYLTLNGQEPSDYSTDGLIHEDDYHLLNYKDFIIVFLKEIKTKVRDNDSIKSWIEQYEKLLEILLEKQNLSNEVLTSNDKWIILKNCLNSNDVQIKKYTKDLLLNYIYPDFIKNNIKLYKDFTPEGNIIYYWIKSKRRKDFYILFEFTDSLEVVYYPVLHDRDVGKNGKWYCGNKSLSSWINWTKDTEKFFNERQSLQKIDSKSFSKTAIKGLKSIKEMLEFIKDSPLPTKKN